MMLLFTGSYSLCLLERSRNIYKYSYGTVEWFLGDRGPHSRDTKEKDLRWWLELALFVCVECGNVKKKRKLKRSEHNGAHLQSLVFRRLRQGDLKSARATESLSRKPRQNSQNEWGSGEASRCMCAQACLFWDGQTPKIYCQYLEKANCLLVCWMESYFY